MNQTEADKVMDHMTRFCERFRFQIIDYSITIESIVSEILIDITSNKITRPSIEKHLFSDATTLELKINLFNSLNKTGVFEPLKNDKDINADLIYIKTLRNYMAHSNLDTSNDAILSYNWKEIRFRSITTKGSKVITIHYDAETDDMSNLVFSQKIFVDKLNRTIDKLILVQNHINIPRQ